MSADSRQQVRDLMQRAEGESGRTPEGIATAEEAVRLADALGDLELGFETRQVLMENATFGGSPEKLLVAFSWCLAQADKDPNWDPESWLGMSLLWRYKWVIENAVDFPGISRPRILAMIEDFRTRSLSAGYKERPALDLRFTVERRMGHLDTAREWLERWRLAERDALSDCPACELNGIISFLVDSGRHAEAIQEAAPILLGQMQCAEIPHHTHGTLLESFWQTGRVEEAAHSHAAGYRLVRGSRAFIQSHADHLRYLVRAKNLERAVTLLRKHLPWALEARSGEDRFQFLLAGRALFRSLSESGVKSIRIRLANDLCPVAGKTSARTSELHGWIEPILRDLAGQFDSRNENRWFGSQLGGR